MDAQSIRERLITGFRPTTKNIATPYFGDLDGEFMLQGISGKQSLEFNEQATEQTIGKDGVAINKVNGRKLGALMVQACLRARSTGEPVYTLTDVMGEKGDGNGALLELDNAVFQPLISDIYAFTGKKDAPAEVKKSSETTQNGSDTSSLPQDSAEPLTNSLEALTAQS
jgi:hypothetical protein